MAVTLRGEEGGKGLAIKKEKKIFLNFLLFLEKVPTAIKLEGVGGVKALRLSGAHTYVVG